MTQAAIYTRVSTDEQAQTGTSLAIQEAACRAYCERAGWDVVSVESDEGVSGATMVRPALARVIALAESRTIAAVVILSIDRAARNTLGWLQLQEHLRAHGCEIHAVREPADATPWGQLSSTVRSGFAQFERDLIRERTMAGKLRALREGRWTQGTPPYGYRRGADGRLEIVPDEAEAIRTAYEVLRAGGSVVDAAERLNRLGYRTRSGKPWRHTTLHRNLTNPATEGSVVWRAYHASEGDVPAVVHMCRDAHPPILPPGSAAAVGLTPHDHVAWRYVQPQARHLKPRRAYPLSGLIRCPCGHTYSVWATDPGRGYWYYACRGLPTAHEVRGGRCYAGPSVRSDRIEPEVWAVVWEDVWTVPRLTELARELATDWDRMQATAHETIEGAGRQLRDLAAREARIVDAIEAGGELHALTTRLTEIAADRADLQVAMSDAEALLASSPPGLPADLQALLEELRASAQTWPRQEQNVILRSAIDRIEMHADGTYTIQPGRRIPGRM